REGALALRARLVRGPTRPGPDPARLLLAHRRRCALGDHRSRVPEHGSSRTHQNSLAAARSWTILGARLIGDLIALLLRLHPCGSLALLAERTGAPRRSLAHVRLHHLSTRRTGPQPCIEPHRRAE